MPELEEWYRLSQIPGSAGLNCEESGVSLAGVALLRKTDAGLAPRPAHEIEALIKGAYGRDADVIRLESGLRVASEALNRGDIGRAMIATVLLRLPDLSGDGAAGIARADDVLAKYDPDEPRDWRGRWTAGDAGSAKPQPSRNPVSTSPVGQRRSLPSSSRGATSSASSPETDTTAATPNRSWNRPARLYGGRIIPAMEPMEPPGIGDNRPPPEFATHDAPGEQGRPRAKTAPDIEPASPPLGYIPGDPNYPMNDGVLWPTATHDVILKALTRTGRKDPSMVIFVPIHGAGPILTGPDQDKNYPTPEGYLPVTLIGIPQVTRPAGRRSFHAHDSVDEALGLAETNQFGTIYFNRAWSTLTNGEVKSRVQHDVVAVVRPGADLGLIYHPSEVLSPGQTREQQQLRIPKDPRINRKLGIKRFRLSGNQRSPYFEYFDTPDYDA